MFLLLLFCDKNSKNFNVAWGSITNGTIETHCIVETGNRLDSTIVTIRSNGGASKNKK